MLLGVCLLLSYTPLNRVVGSKVVKMNLNTFLIHGGHYETLGTDNHMYYIDFAFNMTPQTFQNIYITSEDNTDFDHVSGTLVSGAGSTANTGGSSLEITSQVTIEFNGGSIAVYIPASTSSDDWIVFDY